LGFTKGNYCNNLLILQYKYTDLTALCAKGPKVGTCPREVNQYIENIDDQYIGTIGVYQRELLQLLQ
jgi:hypothetical protein